MGKHYVSFWAKLNHKAVKSSLVFGVLIEVIVLGEIFAFRHVN